MKPCLIQCDPELRTENIGLLRWAIENVEADLYVTPELFLTGFASLAANWEFWSQQAEATEHRVCAEVMQTVIKHRPQAAVVCGFLECCEGSFFNSATVIGSNWSGKYRQVHPATKNGKRVLPIARGRMNLVPLSPSDTGMVKRLGLMICNDYRAIEEFFARYRGWDADLVAVLADSVGPAWVDDVRRCCHKFELGSVVCNAAGVGKGRSCVINRFGEFEALTQIVPASDDCKCLGQVPCVATALI